MATEMARMRDVLDAARNIRDGENEWRQYGLACWVAEHADAIEVGLRMMALPKAAYVDIGQEPRARGHPWELYIEPSDASRPANYSGATLLDVLRALDGGDDDGHS